MKSGFKHLISYLLVTFLCLIFVPLANAHKVSVYAYAENGRVYAEGYFVDGTKVKNSVIEVFDGKDGTKLLEGKTNEEGEFAFQIPKATSLKLVLHASMGHQAEFTLGEDEVKAAMGVKQPLKASPVKSPPQAAVTAAKKTPKKEISEAAGCKGLSESEIETIVGSTMDKKIQPLMRMLVQLRESSGKPKFTEIIGGIGYIIGILGIVAYFKGRRGIKKD
jgi:nickel transport protein